MIKFKILKNTYNKLKNIAFFTLLFCAILTPFTPSHAIGLKENSMVTDSTIKLGDIFYGLDKDAERVLGAAPAPGQEMILNARTLLRIAMALDLSWRPTHSDEYITLRRQATIIDGDTIRENLKAKLADDHALGDYIVNIPSEYQKIILPYDQPATMDITDVTLDRERKMFSAVISAPSTDNPIQKFTIKGSIDAVITVPALLDTLQNGRLIKEQDIQYIQISELDYSRDMFVDAQQLIGMTARRMIVAGRPIRAAEIVAPQIIGRGDVVTLSLSDGVLNLTTQAKALEGGAKGEFIRVVNTGSNQTLQAMVTGEKEVQIVNN